MTKKIIIAVFCIFMATVPTNVWATEITTERKNAIIDNCENIKAMLVNLQHEDSRVRVYLGRYYETIISKFITPLNVRLVENNLSSSGLIDNQNDFAKVRADFMIDYIEYQKGLEELVATNCENEPEAFYEKLEKVRDKRKIVAKDATKIRSLASKQIDLVLKLKESLK